MCFDLCITPVRTPCGAESGVRVSRRERIVFGLGPLETAFFALFSFFSRFFSILGRILDHHAFFGRFFPILGRFLAVLGRFWGSFGTVFSLISGIILEKCVFVRIAFRLGKTYTFQRSDLKT